MTLFKKISRRRIISFILAMSLIFTVFAIPMPTGADTLSELEIEYKELEKERTQIQENYQDTINQKQDKEEYSSMLEEQISSTMQQLDILIFRIEVLDNDIAALEKDSCLKKKKKLMNAMSFIKTVCVLFICLAKRVCLNFYSIQIA